MLEKGRVVVGAGVKLSPEAPRRRGKYDGWLDGQTWEFSVHDIAALVRGPLEESRAELRRRLVRRARERRVRLHWQVLEVGALVVRAQPYGQKLKADATQPSLHRGFRPPRPAPTAV